MSLSPPNFRVQPIRKAPSRSPQNNAVSVNIGNIRWTLAPVNSINFASWGIFRGQRRACSLTCGTSSRNFSIRQLVPTRELIVSRLAQMRSSLGWR